MSPPRTRLKDIAAATGFSTNTVSLALRRSPLVTEETRETIAQAAKALTYRPNEIAKSLVQRQTKTIGLILTNIVNPILTQTAQAIELALTQRGYTTLFATSSQLAEQEIQTLEIFYRRQVDGVLIYPTSHNRIDHILALRESGTPVVLLAGEANPRVDTVSLNERLGAYRMTQYLIELGHRRIGMVDSGSLLGNSEKVEGYRRALAEVELAMDPELIRLKPGYSPRIGFYATAELMALRSPPTAIFGSNDAFAIGIMDWCRRNGRRVPDDVSVVGFDDIEFAAYASTPLTTVSYDAAHLAEAAVERLIFLIDAKDMPTPTAHSVEPRIVLRTSAAAR